MQSNFAMLAGMFGVLLCACSTTPQPSPALNSSNPADSAGTSSHFKTSLYRLNVGDKISISVFQEDDLTGEFTVDSDGRINYPLLGRIPVANSTTSQVENVIAQGLSNGFLVNPDVRASVTGYKAIFIGGSVKAPGEYPFKPGLTVQQAVTLAGGITRFAAEKYYVQRSGAPPEQQFRATPDVQIYPGDTVFVQERLF